MGVTFLQRGAASVQMADTHKAQADLRQAEFGKMFRFFLKSLERRPIIFIDGNLDSEGFLIPVRAYEHNVMHNGGWHAYLCPELNQPTLNVKCPICFDGDRANLHSFFTILDLNPYQPKGGGPIRMFTRKLFVATPQTMEKLTYIAQKREGLAGVTLDAMRTGDKKAPRVGDVFDFTIKEPIAMLQQKYIETRKDAKGVETTASAFQVADYDNEVVQLSADELMMLGFGKGKFTPQIATGPQAPAPPPPSTHQTHDKSLDEII